MFTRNGYFFFFPSKNCQQVPAMRSAAIIASSLLGVVLADAEVNLPCVVPGTISNLQSVHQMPSGVTFTDVASELGFNEKQCVTRTSPNCIFPQYDNKLRAWDEGGFCMEETLSGGACVGDVNADGVDDIYYPRLDGSDILYLNLGNGSFVDATKQYGLHNPKIRSNGCHFLDIENDGDNDLYVSTLGDDRFYLFVNNLKNDDGDEKTSEKFTEEAIERGLGNIKADFKLTAGFTIAVGDYDLDGYLDILTTEWLPWLDEVDTSNCGVNENGPSCQIQIDGIDDAVEYFKRMNERRSEHADHTLTNARMFHNLGTAGTPGFFEDVTKQANVAPKFRSQERKGTFMGATCAHIKKDALVNTMNLLGETVDSTKDTASLQDQFRTLVAFFKDGKQGRRHIEHGKSRTDPSQYAYVRIGKGGALKDPGTLTVRVRLLADETSRGEKAPSLDVVANLRENPTLKRGHYAWKTKANQKSSNVAVLKMNVGGSYGRNVYVGLKCNNKSGGGCDVDVSFHHQPNSVPPQCLGRKPRKSVVYVGSFHVDLIQPWVQSEKFVSHVTQEMFVLNYTVEERRTVVKNLLKFAGKLDDERVEKMSTTQSRVQSEMSRLPQSEGMKAMGDLQGHGSGKRKMNHASNFPLVGAFQFAAKFVDLDADGYPEIVISGDFGTSQLYWNQRDGTFVPGHFHLIEDLFDNSMGATVGDWDLDGRPDVMFTSASISDSDLHNLNQVAATAGMLLSFRGNHLYRNVGGRKFQDVTDHAGLRESGWGWGAFLFDFDNDGDLDALNGNGMDDHETTDDDWAINQKMKLYVNQGRDENFAMADEATARGIASLDENRAAMPFDFDGDGDLDVFVVNHGGVPSLFRNNGGNYYDFLRVYVYEESGRESVGAKVFVYRTEEDYLRRGARQGGDGHEEDVLYREIGSTAAFLGQGESHAHFGLGKMEADAVYAVQILWPPVPSFPQGSQSQTHFNVPIRSTLKVQRGRSGAGGTGALPVCS